MSTFDAVVFDLDGTLCHRTQDTDALYHEAFESVGVEPFAEPAALWACLDGPPEHDDQVGYIGAGFARLAAQHGRTDVDPVALAAAFTDRVDDSNVELSTGARAALDSAREVGAVGLVTNGPQRRQGIKLDALGIRKYFETTVYAYDLPRRKPHAAPFERALADLDVEPSDALYVGNSLGYDVAGAQNAGMVVAWLRGEGDSGMYDPEYILDSLDALPALLEGER
ncbi:HAD family hydrolase [Halovenus salina]|uniref:HAD family hydrolase n=1 Tax=Halovenus salina TaxID=1510225 RepID=A0ABD5W684_9EURY|nr:HAD family hydrolase [Halovenus salina]